MSVDYIRYDILVQDALRGVVRTVLSDAAAKGLLGEHHFFITFDTHGEGVKISPRLLAQYPERMTIVLQHQFWDLTVTQDGFEVGLSFNGIPERLVVPLTAITAFADPSVQFHLQLLLAADEEQAEEPEAKPGEAKRPPARHERTPRVIEPPPVPANPAPVKPEDGPDKPQGGGEVVRLDRFRKK